MAAESRDYIILNHSDCGYSFLLVYFQFFTLSLPDVCFCDFLLLFCLLLLVNNVQMFSVHAHIQICWFSIIFLRLYHSYYCVHYVRDDAFATVCRLSYIK